ncbi:hypothetical protein [Pararhizobium sp. A13]|uniref:hypothetical protein n=1 Tax=Pararhizobium sp. A13 TaxID=3133975 RepID=UPI0032470F5E
MLDFQSRLPKTLGFLLDTEKVDLSSMRKADRAGDRQLFVIGSPLTVADGNM